MGAQVAQLGCGKGALQLGAAVRLFSSVDAPVASERSTIYSCVVAPWLIALVWLLPCVLAPGMYYQGSSLCCCVPAALVAAVKGLLTCVGAIVCC